VPRLFHKPVLLKEAIEFLAVKPGERYIDATVGGGGHSEAILKVGGIILGIDCDPEAITAARRRLSSACPGASWRLVRGNFADLKKIAAANGFSSAAGILFDLGVSSYQLGTPKRGFSFNLESPLDMRMDLRLMVTAADLVNGLTENELTELFFKFGEEKCARRIARAICRARKIRPITTTNELAEVILRARPRRGKFDRTHPATRCFQALRIAVNDELNSLKAALPQALEILKPEGRLVVISFHSLEDRIVKNFLKLAAGEGRLEILTKKPIRPTEEEVEANPRSRSAKLRAGEKK
jgi:16S rRNA (cytosine1402-N4)-methyltransferase